ncbi:hypothetical protein B0H94_104188 [Salsuginibacillus halophilus]|uniref:DUF4190 domain-containing protein n=1 Tax=Salsuginibacillus halophilus TaxID=517424 RepID=A0A2P8HQU5_9BACI|nr:DUF4190 domain-containing protein [Salsuginibacillus halophilus]PSL48587.1 hypothetical protein B0H94_104188 [Salsuginibacillus halophilus]
MSTVQTEAPQTAENGFAVASLVLGIIAVVFNLIPFIPYGLAILAIIFGALGLRNSNRRGMAIAGLILGGIALLLKAMFWIFIIFVEMSGL